MSKRKLKTIEELGGEAVEKMLKFLTQNMLGNISWSEDATDNRPLCVVGAFKAEHEGSFICVYKVERNGETLFNGDIVTMIGSLPVSGAISGEVAQGLFESIQARNN